ncbi:MAG: virulence factor, partial [Chloroflexota bacterium]|nr:virulence factor [Chloroflexota bacterium]
RMARYRVLSWRDIPTQIQATDDSGARAKLVRPRWLIQEVSGIKMGEGLAGTDDYLDGFAWSQQTERAGTADEVAEAVAAELTAKWGRTRDGRRRVGEKVTRAEGT